MRTHRETTAWQLLIGLMVMGCGNAQNESPRTSPTDDLKNNPPAMDDETDPAEDNETEPANSADVYAHVIGVTTSGETGAYNFSVTVESADLDCTQYADWWEVVTADGELRYRRILAHSHTAANGTGNPFTRDGGPVPVQADETVVIRAHMNTVGYQGKVMTGSVAGGFAAATDVASDFGANLVTADPLPDGCAF